MMRHTHTHTHSYISIYQETETNSKRVQLTITNIQCFCRFGVYNKGNYLHSVVGVVGPYLNDHQDVDGKKIKLLKIRTI